jgi:hypothetical protein
VQINVAVSKLMMLFFSEDPLNSLLEDKTNVNVELIMTVLARRVAINFNDSKRNGHRYF